VPSEGGVRGGGDESPEFEELEAWDFEETICHAQQLVESMARDSALGAGRERAGDRTNSAIPSPARSAGTLPWLSLALGIGVFVCGAALMGLSLVKDSTPLWQLGLPMVLGGQLAVLFVVIWQLDVVWHSNRATFVALHAMDEQLRQLRLRAGRAAVREPLAKPFARHAAEEVSPHLLLSHLRSQLEVLATRLDSSKDAA